MGSGNLSGYELAWIVVISVGLLINIITLIRALVNRNLAELALTEAGYDWEKSKERIVARQRIRDTSLKFIGQLGGLVLGIIAGFIAPSPVRQGLSLFNVAVSVFILGLAVYLAVSPLLDLIDDYRVFSTDQQFAPDSARARRERALARLPSLVGIFLGLTLVSVSCYALTVWQDLRFQADGGGLAFSVDRFFGQFTRGVLSQLTTASVTGLFVSVVIVAYVRLHYEMDPAHRAE